MVKRSLVRHAESNTDLNIMYLLVDAQNPAYSGEKPNPKHPTPSTAAVGAMEVRSN